MSAKSTKSINLAIQGGGAHGALIWGILDKFLEYEPIQFDSISATSAGAMNAIILASGMAEGGREGARAALKEFWEKISHLNQIYNPIKVSQLEDYWGIKPEHSISYHLFNLLSSVLSPYQFNPLTINPLQDLIAESVNFKKVRAYKGLKLYLSATNVRTGKIHVFSKNELTVESVMASGCLPFLFQAVKIGNDYYWDGGYMGNPALFPLIYNAKSPDILILHINPIERNEVPTTSAQILNRINEISFNSSLMREMRAVAFVTKLLDNNYVNRKEAKNIKRIYMHSIRADKMMQKYSVASKLTPDLIFIRKLFELGRQQASHWITENFQNIGKKSTIDLNEYL